MLTHRAGGSAVHPPRADVARVVPRVVRWVVAALFVLHGLVHVLGFTATWRFGSSGVVSGVPTLAPGLGAGSPVVVFLGVLWLAAGAAFVAAAVGLVAWTEW